MEILNGLYRAGSYLLSSEECNWMGCKPRESIVPNWVTLGIAVVGVVFFLSRNNSCSKIRNRVQDRTNLPPPVVLDPMIRVNEPDYYGLTGINLNNADNGTAVAQQQQLENGDVLCDWVDIVDIKEK